MGPQLFGATIHIYAASLLRDEEHHAAEQFRFAFFLSVHITFNNPRLSGSVSAAEQTIYIVCECVCLCVASWDNFYLYVVVAIVDVDDGQK